VGYDRPVPNVAAILAGGHDSMSDQTPARPAPRNAESIDLPCGGFHVRLDLELPGDASSISHAVDEVLALASDTGCAQGKEFEVETALREALANAIRYGCEHNREKTVQLSVACDQALGMMIVVRDPGPGFDPSQVPSPVEGEQLYSNHGRGIFLISQMMDHVEYGRGGTEIRMIKR
jgi:serine/threonine-protein kinase RsbW